MLEEIELKDEITSFRIDSKTFINFHNKVIGDKHAMSKTHVINMLIRYYLNQDSDFLDTIYPMVRERKELSENDLIMYKTTKTYKKAKYSHDYRYI